MYGASKSLELKEKLKELKTGDNNPSKRKEVIEKIRKKRVEKIKGNEFVPHWEFIEMKSGETFNVGFGWMKFFCESKNINIGKIKYRLSKSDEFVYLNWKVRKI